MEGYNILDDVKTIADQYDFKKPDDIDEGSWKAVSLEAIYIHSYVKPPSRTVRSGIL